MCLSSTFGKGAINSASDLLLSPSPCVPLWSFRHFRPRQVWEVTVPGPPGNNSQQIAPILLLLGRAWAVTEQEHSAPDLSSRTLV